MHCYMRSNNQVRRRNIKINTYIEEKGRRRSKEEEEENVKEAYDKECKQ